MSPKQGPRASLRRRLLKPAVAIVATLVGLLASEVVVRVIGLAPGMQLIELGSDECVYERSTNPILSFELKANYRHDDPDFIQSYARTNAHGQRDRERSLEKPPGVRRVLLLGDSVVEGYGLREEETMSRRLEGLYPDGTTEVLNFGVAAYCTRAEIELLEVKGLRFDPDVAVLVFVENDFDNFNREAFPLGRKIERPAVVKALFLWSHLFRWTCVRWNLFHFGAETDPVAWSKDAIGDNNVVEGLQRFRELADQHGFLPLVAIWPRFLDDRIVDVHFMPRDDKRLVIEHLARVHGIPSVRLSEYFKRYRGEVNPRLRYSSGDELHPSEEGSKVAAGALKQILADLDAGRLSGNAEVPSSPGADAAAVEVARALGKTAPTYGRVYNRMGLELMKAGKVAEAVEQFKKAVEADPKHAGAHNNLGVAYERLGLAAAQSEFERAVILQPDFAHAHVNLSRSLLKKGRVTAAIAGFQRVLEIDPDLVSALNVLGMELAKLGRHTEARSHLERAVRLQPDHSEAHNNLGVVYVGQGHLREAVAQFEEALRANPDNRRARENLGRTQSLLEK